MRNIYSKKTEQIQTKRNTAHSKRNTVLYSVVFTVIMVICSIGICYIADSADNKYALKADMSFNAATIQSEITNEMLRSLEYPVNIIMLSSGSNEYEEKTLEILLDRYSAENRGITVEKTKYITSPYLDYMYVDELGKNRVSNDCLIIHCKDTNRTRIVSSNDYYSRSYDMAQGIIVDEQNYESVITGAIMYVSSDELPEIQFSTGHREIGEQNLSVMINDFRNANYSVRFIDLDRDIPDPSFPLFIISPKADFSSSELLVLEQFARDGGDFFVVYDSSGTENMQNLESFLAGWGIFPIDGVLISKSDSINNIQTYIKPTVQNSNATSPLLAADITEMLLINSTAFNSVDSFDGSYRITKILSCDKSYPADDLTNTNSIADDGFVSHDVSLLSERTMPSGLMSRMFIIGDAELFIDQNLHDKTSAAAFLLEMTQYINPHKFVSLGIQAHKTQRAVINTANLAPALAVVFLLPLLVFITAMIILFPRRNR